MQVPLELYFAFVGWQSRKLVVVCRILSVVASVAALAIELIIISSIKINIASFGVGIYLCIITLAVNIICCTAVCVLSIKDSTVQKA